MISRCFLLNKPLFLKPAAKNYLWGGNRLNADFAKGIPLSPLAETWECSTHPDGESVVVFGEYAGQTLRMVLRKHPDWLGEHAKNDEGELPILVKLIDAKKNLSVQVHPNDSYAQEFENGQRGKDEMWYVLDADKDARLLYGLKHDCTEEELCRSIDRGTLEDHLQDARIQPDDVFYIPAGIIHAIGAGCLIAEVQESSNLTYRLYDYNRKDKNGRFRELHIDKAMSVARMTATAIPRQPMRVLRYRPACAQELLCRSSHFQVERVLLNTERHRERVTLETDGLSFQVLLCLRGCGSLSCGLETTDFFKGDCVFIPAHSRFTLHGRAEFLTVRC